MFTIPIKRAKSLPKNPGVYLFKDKTGNVLYIGKSINLYERVLSHTKATFGKSQKFSQLTHGISYIPVISEFEALLLEAHLIKKHIPAFNTSAKDDKHPLYIKITKSEKYPRVLTSRKEDNLPHKDIYFGPFPSTTTVKQVLKQIRKIFPYCNQKPQVKKACFYSHLGLCNPCPGEIEKTESSKEKQALQKLYKKNNKQILMLLQGKTNTLQKKLQKEMQEAARKERFEKASSIRDQLQKLKIITQPYNKTKDYLENPDLFFDKRKEEKTALYKILRPFFPNLTIPERIECLDVSHTGGQSATCSLVTFINGEPDKNFYRRFKIRSLKTKDDFAMLTETIKRRTKHFKDWGKPDLVLIDGGKGQVSAVKQALESENVNIPVIGLAKRYEEVVIPQPFPTNFKIFKLSRANPALHLLQRLRDEAHRFARAYHFKLRLKELLR